MYKMIQLSSTIPCTTLKLFCQSPEVKIKHRQTNRQAYLQHSIRVGGCFLSQWHLLPPYSLCPQGDKEMDEWMEGWMKDGWMDGWGGLWPFYDLEPFWGRIGIDRILYTIQDRICNPVRSYGPGLKSKLTIIVLHIFSFCPAVSMQLGRRDRNSKYLKFFFLCNDRKPTKLGGIHQRLNSATLIFDFYWDSRV